MTSTILDQYFQGKLDQLKYPYFAGEGQEEYKHKGAQFYGQQQTLIVFMVGGATFGEAQEFADFIVPSQGME